MENLNQDLTEQYINSLNEMEKKALNIATTQLESSFDINKSIGFLEFIKNKK